VSILILIEKATLFPKTLNGYAGTVMYESNRVTANLESTLRFFFSENFKSLIYLFLFIKQKNAGEVNTSEIEEIEKVILAVSKVGRAPLSYHIF
jgi:predicted secreted acid phosphatase